MLLSQSMNLLFQEWGFTVAKVCFVFFALPTDTYFYLHDLTINQPKLTF